MTSIFDKLEPVIRRSQEIDEAMASPDVATDFEKIQALAKERASLETLVEISHKHVRLVEEQQDLNDIIDEDSDPELTRMAREDLRLVEQQLEDLAGALKIALLPKDPNDDRDVIVEIRSGAGGQGSQPLRQRPVPGLCALRPDPELAGRRHGLKPVGLGRVQQDCVRSPG